MLVRVCMTLIHLFAITNQTGSNWIVSTCRQSWQNILITAITTYRCLWISINITISKKSILLKAHQFAKNPLQKEQALVAGTKQGSRTDKTVKTGQLYNYKISLFRPLTELTFTTRQAVRAINLSSSMRCPWAHPTGLNWVTVVQCPSNSFVGELFFDNKEVVCTGVSTWDSFPWKRIELDRPFTANPNLSSPFLKSVKKTRWITSLCLKLSKK